MIRTATVPADPPAIPDWAMRDPEWSSTLCLLLGRLLRTKDLRRYIDFNRRRIAWNEIVPQAAAWSHGERLVLDVARTFYTGEGSPDLGEMIAAFSASTWGDVLSALRMRLGMDVPWPADD